MNNERKEEAICPKCGQWNYKPPTMYRSKVLDDMGIEYYVTLKENQIDLDSSCQKWISEVGLSNATVAIIESDKESEDE